MAPRFAAAWAALLLAGAPALHAQGVGLSVGHFFQNGGWTAWRAGLAPVGAVGPLAVDLEGVYLSAPGPAAPRLYGAGAEASLFRGGRPGLYLMGSVEGGLARAADGAAGATESRTWWGWSGGAGYELRPFQLLSVAVEARWREAEWPGRSSGLELGFRLGVGGTRWSAPSGRSTPPAAPAAMPGLPPAGAAGLPPAQRWWSYGPADSIGLRPDATDLALVGSASSAAHGIVQTALDAVGTRYQWGGSGDAGDGFDCSGLIQYAYGQHGIDLPRTAAEQARAGRPVKRRLDQLRPGDLLAFARDGRRVTHVGMYLGDGRFVHSATTGVQVSRLSADDPAGRWWWDRWVAARRILP